MYVLPVSTFDVVTGCGVEHGDAQILIHLLPDRSALDLKRGGTRVKANADGAADCAN